MSITVSCLCGNQDTAVIDSRAAGDMCKRRRECRKCEARFTTYEIRAERLDAIERAGKVTLTLKAVLQKSLRDIEEATLNG